MIDGRAQFGLDPNGLISRPCPACNEAVRVRTERDDDGTQHYFCDQCGDDLGSAAANIFQPPESSD